ncbi:MAG: response regulator [Bryobacterales bacterium]|nr:response regulator [Bryobacterales bacterium]
MSAFSQPALLAILPDPQDHLALHGILQFTDWRRLIATSFEEALRILAAQPIQVILSEYQLPDGKTWKEILWRAEMMTPPPPVIVVDGLASELLWLRVLDLGGYDLLPKPFSESELLRVLHLATREARKPAAPLYEPRLAVAIAHC